MTAIPPLLALAHGRRVRLRMALSEAQEAFRLWCVRNGIGIPHALADTIDDALAALDRWNCFNIRIPARAGKGGAA
jgi:hypothetical protein